MLLVSYDEEQTSYIINITAIINLISIKIITIVVIIINVNINVDNDDDIFH